MIEDKKLISYFTGKDTFDFDDLVKLMGLLRSENGCPWDREQTHKSIRNNFIEECYEAVEGIDKDDVAILREELGDVLLQVVFHARISEDADEFNIGDVTTDICKKLIVRHPHIFGDVSVNDSSEVLKNWDEIKKKTKSLESGSSVMDSVSNSLPALMRAEKVQKKAKREHFDFSSASEVAEKLDEEVKELKCAVSENNAAHIEEELGDLLFTCVNYSRFLHINAEEALTKATDKFIERYRKCESLAAKDGKKFAELDFEAQNAYWDIAKSV